MEDTVESASAGELIRWCMLMSIYACIGVRVMFALAHDDYTWIGGLVFTHVVLKFWRGVRKGLVTALTGDKDNG